MATISKPNTFSADTTILSSEVNDNFDTIYNEFNGSINAANLASDAITSVKITDASVTTAKIAAANVTAPKLEANLRAGWIDTSDVPDTVTYNGNRSYDLVFNSNDLTDTVSNGMRLQMTRTVTAPTQCTDLESGSSQYWSKSSPTGITFTDDFTCMAWIKLESYVQGGIISRFDGTTGWYMRTLSDGTLQLVSDAGANTEDISSYQSLPLNKWVHVAASINASAGTGAVYIDGVEVPSAYSGSGVTTLTQAGDLEIGAQNGGSGPQDGKIAQVGLFDAVLSASTIRSYASQTLSGSETNCIGAWKFNGDGTDENANANDLSAQGSAVATATDTPFAGGATGTTEYGIVTANSFSTNTTLTIQVPEGYAIPTSGGVSAVLYSTHSTPYGFPRGEGKWVVENIYTTDKNETVAINTWEEITGVQFTVPVGSWEFGHRGHIEQDNSSGGITAPRLSLSTSTTAVTNQQLTITPVIRDSVTTTQRFSYNTSESLDVSSSTVYYMIVTSGGGGGTITAGLANSNGDDGYHSKIYAKCAYL